MTPNWAYSSEFTAWVAIALMVCFVCPPVTALAQQTDSMQVQQLESCVSHSSCQDIQVALYDLANRKDFSFLMHTYSVSSPVNQEYIVGAIENSGFGRNNPEIVSFMNSIAFDQHDTDSFSTLRWSALQFLADICDDRALNELRKGGATRRDTYKYSVACGVWANTLTSFGKCHYFSATRTLIDSTDTSCLDVGNAALDSLNTLYPGKCTNAHDFRAANECFTKAQVDVQRK